MTRKPIRYALFFVSAFDLIVAVAFFLRLPLAVSVWPFPGTTPLTFIFVSSIAAAVAAATFWVAASENYGALAGIGLDYIAILTCVSVLSFQLAASGGDPKFTISGYACAFGAVVGLGAFLWSVRIPIDRTIPMPTMVRWSLIVFVLALLAVSTRLILKVPNSIPWTITPDLSVLIGLMFLGAASYFVYALARPSWLNSAGQLAGFLAYDLVLILPFLTRLPTVAAEQRLGLIVYTIVLVYSGLVAAYYLFVAKSTRVWVKQDQAGAAVR